MFTKQQPSFRDFMNLQSDYLSYFFKKSLILHRNLKNIDECGEEIEYAIRELMQSIIPDRFKVTHGYIAYVENNKKEPMISPQCDLIIVDTLVPHKLFIVDSTKETEVVPQEAVVGIFEIKRTLTKKIFKDACKQIFSILNSIKISKENKENYLPGGVHSNSLNTSIRNNPIIGILSLEGINNIEKLCFKWLNELNKDQKLPPLDIISCFQKLLIVTAKEDVNKQLIPTPIRCRVDDIKFTYLRIQGDNENGFYLSRTIGFILAYLMGVSGRISETIAYYYFNEKV